MVSRGPSALLHIPKPALADCLLGGVERDTRGCELDELERFNYYPATPLATISWIFEGTVHLIGGADPAGQALPAPLGDPPMTAAGPALARVLFSGPQRRPTMSWTPGPVHSLMVGVYPEAMALLLGRPITPWVDRTVPLDEVAPAKLLAICQAVLSANSRPFVCLEAELEAVRSADSPTPPVPLLSHWVRRLMTRAAHAGAGRSLRQWQRRIRDWTGQTQRDLQMFVRLEEAFMQAYVSRHSNQTNLADIAAATGFADQSHMGREIRRVTGLSPRRFADRMARDEAFWYYRLLAGEFQRARTSCGEGDTA